MSIIRADQLAKNNTKESCWILLDNTVWDVTNFLSEHPGGANLILKVAGKDATEQYSTFHGPSLVSETLSPSCRLGTLDTSSLPDPTPVATPKTQIKKLAPLRSMINLADFQASAEKTMTPLAWAYVSSGTDNESTMHENALAYQRVFLRGRILRRVSAIDLTTSVLGQQSSLPIYTSPVGLGKLVHPDGECAIAVADGKEGIIQVVNTVSSRPIEEIMDARVRKDQPVFWQLYANSDLEKSKAFVERVERCGVKAIWLTVDSPVTGNRERDERRAAADIDVDEDFESVVDQSSEKAGVAASTTTFINADIDWNIIKWLRSITRLPVVVKGILCVEDAVLAYEHGVDGIVLSNHGGRSQDTSQPPLLTLLEIRTYAPHIMGKRMQIFIDGGVRRGTDVLKALCLGATAVGIGRPVLFGMSGYGHYGIRRMIQILRKELQTNMAYLGARNLGELRPEMVNTKPLEKMMASSPNL